MKPRSADMSRHAYLKEASSLLAMRSPAVSSRLGLESLAPQDTTEKLAKAIDFCTACGSLMVPGWSCKEIADRVSKRRRQDRSQKTLEGGKISRLECLRCHAFTVVESRRPARRSPNTAQSRVEPQRVMMRRSPEPEIKGFKLKEAEDSIVHPPRKRARSKKSSLQALVSKQGGTAHSAVGGFGLDLIDFMKT